MPNLNSTLRRFGVDQSNLEMHEIDRIVRQPEDIVVHDYPCGFGKSTRLLAGLKTEPAQQVLIVVPDLEQVRALIRNAEQRYRVTLYQPLSEASEKEDKETGTPFAHYHSTKRDALQALVQKGHKVITTHKLYSDIACLARDGLFRNVVIHIDEVVSVADEATSITQFKRSHRQTSSWRDLYLDKGYVSICPQTGEISPTDAWRERRDCLDGNLPTQFFDAADAGRLFTNVPGLGEHVIIRELPIVLFKCAKKVNIYTYRFEGSYMASYLRRHGVEWTQASYEDASPEEADRRFRAQAAELVTIDALPRLDRVSLSYSAQERMVASNSGAAKQRVGQVRGAFRSIGRSLKSSGTPAGSLLLTCLKAGWTKRDGRSGKFAHATKLFTEAAWVANQTRGTNQYRHCSHVAYFWQQNPNANVARFLGCDDKMHADAYAVAEMIQFIWRSRVRDGHPITVFMPCPKMRKLWTRWVEGEI